MLLLGHESWLFTGILPDGYAAPDTFCFDFVCKDEPIMVSFVCLYTVFLFFVYNYESVIG
jgi:hypothetical protein